MSLVITLQQAMSSSCMFSEKTWVFKWMASLCLSALNCRRVCKCLAFSNLLFSHGEGQKRLMPTDLSLLREKVFHPTVFMLQRHHNLPVDFLFFSSLCLPLNSREHFAPPGHSWSICWEQMMPLWPCINPVRSVIRLPGLWGLNGDVLWNTLLCIKGDWPAAFYKVWNSGEKQCSASGNRT